MDLEVTVDRGKRPTASGATNASQELQPTTLVAYCAGIFLLAFLVRLLFIKLFAVAPVNDLLWNDAVGWNLASGHGFTASQAAPFAPGIYRTPGYPAFLALIYLIFGHSHLAVYTCQALVDSCSTVLTMLIARELLSFRSAVITGLLYATYPYSAIFCGILHQDILLTFSAVVILFLVVGASRQPRNINAWLPVGLGVGMATLVKPLFLFFVFMPGLVALTRARSARQIVARLSLLALGVAIMVTPWVIRNYLVFHSFPPLAVGGTGTNLTYLLAELEGGEEELIRRSRGGEVGAENSPGYLEKFIDGAALIEIEKKLATEAASKLTERWPQYALLMLKHIPRLWVTHYTIGRDQTVAVAGAAVSVAYLIFGIWGMYLLRRRWRSLLPLYATIALVTLMYAPYTAEARYTLPARAALIVFISASIAKTLRGLRGYSLEKPPESAA